MDVDLEHLLSRIRESAARRKLEMPSAGARVTLAALYNRPHSEFDLPEIRLSPEFKTRRDNQYHINDLLQFHDREFVRNAYRAILKREPDEPGLNTYLERLRSGHRNKIDILASLRFSPEGRQRKVRVDGLRIPALLRSLTRVPVLGYAYELASGVLRLPVAIHNLRRFESHVIAQQERIADHLNRLNRTVSGLEQFVAEVVSLREHSTLQQQELTNLEAAWERQESRLSAHDAALAELSQRDEDLKSRITTDDELLAAHSEFLRQLQRALDHQSQVLDMQRQALQEQRLELSAHNARLATAGRDPRTSRISKALAATNQAEAVLDPLYLLLENRFRGPGHEIKERFRFYLAYLDRENITSNILDVGCGRGEWLELLKENGFSALGVDANQFVVEQCQGIGIDAIHADIFDHFRQIPDQSLNAITAFHVIEHLEFRQLVEFIDQGIRSLRPGGMLLLETPNPENVIVATRNFHLDPSHVRPLPRELVEFLLQARGLGKIEIVGLHPLPKEIRPLACEELPPLRESQLSHPTSRTATPSATMFLGCTAPFGDVALTPASTLSTGTFRATPMLKSGQFPKSKPF
jgi:O-antigen chain-terminating methyltransferase